MNTDVAKGHWSELKGKIKSKWAKFSDQDLKSIENNLEELKGKLQRVYGYTKEKAQEEFQDLFASFKETKDRTKTAATDATNAQIDSAKKKTDETIDQLNS